MKVAVFGGGSSYTPELVKGFLDRVDSFPMTELWLADVSAERLEVVGGFAQRMARSGRQPLRGASQHRLSGQRSKARPT